MNDEMLNQEHKRIDSIQNSVQKMFSFEISYIDSLRRDITSIQEVVEEKSNKSFRQSEK